MTTSELNFAATVPQPKDSPPSVTCERCSVAGETIGWMLRGTGDVAIWCGEISRDTFVRLPAEHRLALRDDLGWYLVEIASEDDSRSEVVLARVANETLGLRLARALIEAAAPLSLMESTTAAERCGAG